MPKDHDCTEFSDAERSPRSVRVEPPRSDIAHVEQGSASVAVFSQSLPHYDTDDEEGAHAWGSTLPVLAFRARAPLVLSSYLRMTSMVLPIIMEEIRARPVLFYGFPGTFAGVEIFLHLEAVARTYRAQNVQTLQANAEQSISPVGTVVVLPTDAGGEGGGACWVLFQKLKAEKVQAEAEA